MRPPFAAVEDAELPEQERARRPGSAGGANDFAASAAMVNDILAARPAGERQDPASPEEAVDETPAHDVSEPSATSASSDFFVSARDKKAPFWRKELKVRRPRKDAGSEGSRALPDA